MPTRILCILLISISFFSARVSDSEILSGFSIWSATGPQEAVSDITSANGKDYVLTKGGLYVSSDDLNWQKLKTFSGSEFYYSVVALQSGEIFLFSYSSYSISVDGGATWKKINQPGFSTRTCVADNLGYLYAGQNDPIQLSTDKGVTWSASSKGTSGGFFDIGEVATDPSGNVVAGNQGITGGMVYRSSDHGMNWELIHSETMKDVYSLAINNGTIWIAYSDKLLYSDDNGAKWNSAGSTPAPVTAMVFTGENEGYVGMANGKVLYSADRGNTWDDHMAGIHGNSVSCLKRTDAERILVGTDSGLFMLTGGVNGVSGGGQHIGELTITPNPAREKVLVNVSDANVSEINIGVYDILGRKILGFPESAKTNSFFLNTSALSAGVYYLEVTMNHRTYVRKFVVAG